MCGGGLVSRAGGRGFALSARWGLERAFPVAARHDGSDREIRRTTPQSTVILHRHHMEKFHSRSTLENPMWLELANSHRETEKPGFYVTRDDFTQKSVIMRYNWFFNAEKIRTRISLEVISLNESSVDPLNCPNGSRWWVVRTEYWEIYKHPSIWVSRLIPATNVNHKTFRNLVGGESVAYVYTQLTK